VLPTADVCRAFPRGHVLRAPRRTQRRWLTGGEALPHEPIRGDETGLFPAHTAAELHRPTQVHSKVSVVQWTPCSGVEWRVFEPTIRVRRSGTTRKQPANLAVEGAEESLSILSDDTPPVRPPLKRC
jgi:hypothetical protein